MAKNLYVGNMAFSTTEDQLREAFSQYGTVTMVQALNGAQLDGRTLTVNEAKPREGGGGGGGGRGGPRGGGGGGYGGGGGGGRRY
jgi:cold-inducible RNA-binding protein